MSLLRFLGMAKERPSETDGETRTVRRIAAQLERLPPDQARYLAAFAYVLARVAQADLRFAKEEGDTIRRIVAELAGLQPAEAELVVEIARSQARMLGGTENYVVTREFRRISTPDQRLQLLECLFSVAAADGTISSAESAEIRGIAEELGFSRQEANALRARYRDQLSEFQGSEPSD